MQMLSETHLWPRTCISLYEGETEEVGRRMPAEGPPACLPPTHSGVARRKGRARRGMAPHRQESPLRTSDHALKRSCLQKYPTPTSTTSFAQNATLFRIKLLPQTHLRTRPCATLYIKKPRRWEAVCPQRGPPSLIRSANSAVAHRQGNKARGMLPCCRESVLRASGNALKHPCLPAQPIPTAPMSLAQNATLFRTKLSSKMHLRTRTCVSP